MQLYPFLGPSALDGGGGSAPRPGHLYPSALDGGGGQPHAPAASTLRKDPVPTIQEVYCPYVVLVINSDLINSFEKGYDFCFFKLLFQYRLHVLVLIKIMSPTQHTILTLCYAKTKMW